MVINRMTEGKSERVGDAEMEDLEDNSNEYQTADEIYQIMAKNDIFEGDGDKALPGRDLVILYENIDLGTKVVPKASQETTRSPNQYVETVIYNDDQGSEGSDISEDISSEDLNYVFAINKERIDLLNNFGNTLCHKFGNIKMHTSELTTEYDRHFLFNDSFVKEKLKSFHKITNSKQSDSTVLPASLLDYILSKHLENNDYNHFYMESIIKYVQNTIEQLKRISNGDYLTDQVKAKWKEVDDVDSSTKLEECNKIILSCSASIPLHVKDKRNKTITWDDIVHSEMDVRSISKILEKKVILEVPKIICCTFKLYSKLCRDNLIITCKRDNNKLEDDSQVDVVLKLQRSKSGHVISDVESIRILKSLPTLAATETSFNCLLPLEFKDEEDMEQDDKNIELKENTESIPKIVTDVNTADCSLAENRERNIEKIIEDEYDFSSECHEDSECVSSQSCCCKGNECSTNGVQYHEENECTRSGIDYSEDNLCSSRETDYPNANESGNRQINCQAETNFDVTAANDLHCIIHRLSMQSPVIEESEENMKKKKSPTRVRIKSPYENKSHSLEEKKRKKLLEIRQKRETKKNAMSESFKITKNRHGRTPIMVQASNSVTKLSITNKYFYNSIYGQSRKYVSSKNLCKYPKDRKHESIPGIKLVDDEDNHDSSSIRATPEIDNQKFINRSYYLDDADTEVKYLQTKQNESQDVSRDDLSTSTTNNEIDVKLIKKLIDPSASTTRFLLDFSSTDTSCGLPLNVSYDGSFADTENENIDAITSKQSNQPTFITKPPETEVSNDYKNGKTMSSAECRKNIDKIYDLIKINSETDNSEVRTSESKIRINTDFDLTFSEARSCDQAREGGTHIQHQLTDISRLIPEKTNTVLKIKTNPKVKFEKPPPFISKVTINPKPQNKLANITNNKLNHSKIQENPLKALSQLIHKIDNVQKSNNKNTGELKSNKKIENFKRTQKHDQYLKDTDEILSKVSTVKERRRQSTGYGPIKIEHQQLQSEETSFGKSKKIADLIDEVKELRGEAVRGPSKNLTRLNSLAQPKKQYLPATHEETVNRFGKRALVKSNRQPLPLSNPDKRQPLSNPVVSTTLRGKQRKVAEGLPPSAKQSHAVGTPSDRSSSTKPSTQRSLSPDENVKYSSLSLTRSPCTRGTVKKTTEQRNGKMSDAGSYVKNSYVDESQLLELGDNPKVQKSKVPFVPQDFHDLGSMTSSPEESINSAIDKSTILGKKLHHMIDNVINTNKPVLDALAECKESISYLDDIFDGSSNDARIKYDEVTISESDHPIDIFKDKNIVTAVSSIKQDTKDDEKINESKSNTNVCKMNQLCTPNEIQKLHNIPQNTSNSKLQNNSEIKRMAIDTMLEQPLENEIILQPGHGYTESLVLKSLSSVKTDLFSNFKMLPDRIDLGFTKFPMQISTVGYALPYFIKRESLTTIRYLENKNSKLNCVKSKLKLENPERNPTMSKSIQCFKGADRVSPQGTIEDIIETVACPFANANINQKILDNSECALQVKNNEQSTMETKTIEDIACIDSPNSNIDNTTSLDILVGLLNEIKKISLFQVDIPKQEKATFDYDDKEVEVILNKVTDKESSIEQYANSSTSLTSLDKLQIVDSQINISYSTPNIQADKFKSVTEKNVTTSTCVLYEPLLLDKEVNAKIFPNEFIHRYTEVPSQFFPVTVSTNITDSLIKLINTPTRSLHSFADCELSGTSVSKEIIAIPSKVSHKSIDSASIDNVLSPAPTLGIQCLNDNKTFTDLKKIGIEQNHSIVDYDPLMKMKRDILVTVYSILVFTVFAALSFPEIVYRL